MSLGSVLLYMGLLGFGAIISPGVGFFGRILGMFPQTVTEWSHVPAYGLLTWLLTGVFRRYGRPRPYALCVSAATASIFGIWMEILQGFVPGRVVDSGDVLLNTVGIALAALLILRRSMSADSEDRLVPACSYTQAN